MKPLVLIILCVSLMVGCSPKGGGSESKSPPVTLVTDLGKATDYFRDIYGPPKAEKQVAEFAFSLPGHGSMIHLARSFIVQDFESGKLKTKVVYSVTEPKAIWVKYTLPNPWTEEQIKAALQAYGSDWKIIQDNPAMSLIMQNRAPAVYQDSNGRLAYKTMVNELIVYGPQLVSELVAKIQEAEQQKKAIPKF